MQFVVESACVADGLAVVIAPPQCRHRRLAVGARRARSPGGRLFERNAKLDPSFVEFSASTGSM